MHRSRATLIALVSLTLAVAFAVPAFAVTRTELREHQAAADKARTDAQKADQRADKLAKEVEELDGQIEKLQAEANALDPSIAKAARRTKKLELEVIELKHECEALQATLTATQVSYDQQRELLANRVEATYKQGDWFYLDVLLGSTDIQNLIARTELVNRVIESNNNIAADLERTRDALRLAKVKLDRTLDEVTLKKREAAEVERELRSLRAAREAKVRSRESAQQQKAGLVRDTRKNAARLRALAEAEERESDRIAAQLAGDGSGYFSGTMAWPVPASHRVTSGFGWRICPFHGRELHPGIDIGRPSSGGGWSQSGRAIVAAGKGRVIYAGYRGGYGNTVIIDHGNGVTTLYAHQAPGGIRVGSGQSVSRGQRIGTVGTTGSSTGLHLHFEVRVNGVPKNPATYR